MSELNRVPNQSNLTGSGSSQEHGKQAAVFASMADNLSRRTRSRKITKRILALVSAFVLVLTSLSLMEPAETMESPVYCGLEAHTHKDECYGEPVLAYPHEEIEPVIVETREYVNWFVPHVHTDACRNAAGEYICGWDERYVHQHNKWCYDEEGNLVCGLEERSAHVHTASCYEEVRTLSCGLEETAGHVHTDACYAMVRSDKLICGLAESDGHVHLDSCYGNACGLEEHVHSVEAGCYDEEGNLTCEIPEHEHTEECIGLVCGKTEGAGAHHHTDECYEKVQTLVCGKTEGEGAHQHTDACYTVENVVTCGYDLHKHDASCGTEGNYTCGHLEIPVFVSSETNWATIRNIVVPGHKHGPECYVRTLICGKVEHVHVSECFDENFWQNHEEVTAEEVAQTEVGENEYQATEETVDSESGNAPASEAVTVVDETAAPVAEENQNAEDTTEEPAVEEAREPADEDEFVEMMEDEADNEETYKEETAEQIEETEDEVTTAPVDEEAEQDDVSETVETTDEFAEADANGAEDVETPAVEENTADEVTEADTIVEDFTEETSIDTMAEEDISTPTDLADVQDEENTEELAIDAVAEEGISTPTDLVDEQDEETSEEAIQVESSIPVSVETENADLNGATVTVTVDENKEAVWNQIQQMLSEQNTQVVLTNARGRRNSARTQADAEVESVANEIKSMTGYTVFDITLTKGEENISETGAITFTLNPKLNVYDAVKAEYSNATGFSVSYELYHLHGGSVDTIVPQVDYDVLTGEVKAVTFTTENLSSFVLSYTVDFEYTDGDHAYAFSIPGGSSITAVDVLKAVGIYHNDREDAELSVVDVQFSNPSLIAIAHIDRPMTVAEIAAYLGVEAHYSAQLTAEDQAIELGKEYAAGEWVLLSLQAFNSEEELKITLSDGQVIEIKVSDAQSDATGNLSQMIKTLTLSTSGQSVSYSVSNNGTVTLTSGNPNFNVKPRSDFDLSIRFQERSGNDALQFTAGEMIFTLPNDLSIDGFSIDDFTMEFDGVEITGNKMWVEGNTLHIDLNENDPNWRLIETSGSSYIDVNIHGRFGESTSEFEFGTDLNVDVDMDTTTDARVNKSANYENGRMHYYITIESDGATTNINFTDTISSTIAGLQTIDAESISVTSNKHNPYSDYTVTSNDTRTVLTGSIPSMENGERVVIEYYADIDMTKVPKNGKIDPGTLSNSVSMTAEETPETPDNNTATTTYNNEINFSTFGKSNKGVDQDEYVENGHTYKDVTYVITSNPEKKISIAGTKIKDEIGDSSKAIMDYSGAGITVVVDKGEGLLDDERYETRIVPWSQLNLKNDSWEYTIPTSDGAYGYTITYTAKVQIDGLLDNVNVHNNAEGTNGQGHNDVGVGPDDEEKFSTNKKLVSYSADEAIWEISVNVPSAGYETLEITDWFPTYGNYTYKDVLDKTYLEIEGLVDGETYTQIEDVSVEYWDNNEQVSTVAGGRIVFSHDGGSNNGLKGTGSPRTVTVKLKTKTDSNWVKYSATDHNALWHNNKVDVVANGTKKSPSDGYSITTQDIVKAIDGSPSGRDIVMNDGTTRKLYKFVLKVAGVDGMDDDQIVIQDYFDTDVLEYLDPASTSDYVNGWQAIVVPGTNYDQFDQSAQFNLVNVSPLTATEGNKGGVVLKINKGDLPKDSSGHWFQVYKVEIYLVTKEAIAEIALSSDGHLELSNEAYFGESHSETSFSYDYPGMSKEMTSYNTSTNIATFRIVANPDKATMNGGNNMELVDAYLNDLSIDYESIRVITDPAGMDVSYDATTTKPESFDPTHLKFGQNSQEANNISYLVFSIPDSTKVTITYEAKLVGKGSLNIYNYAELQGHYGKMVDKWENVGGDTSGGGTITKIRLMKYERDHMENTLGGVEFALYKKSDYDEWYPATQDGDRTVQVSAETLKADQEHHWIKTFTTATAAEAAADQNKKTGMVEVILDQSVDGTELIRGETYVLRELAAPAGYEIDTVPYQFTINEDGNPDYSQYIYMNNDVLNVKNKPKGGLKIVKSVRDANMTEEQKKNITFTVTRIKDSEGRALDDEEPVTFTVNGESTTGLTYDQFVNGNYMVSDLSAGTYRVSEYNTQIEGYDLVGTTVRVDNGTNEVAPDTAVVSKELELTQDELNANTVHSIYFTNTYESVKLTVFKNDEKGNRLSGAEFSIIKNGAEYATFAIDDENKTSGYVLTGLTAGNYVLTETKAPDGYVSIKEEIKFTVAENSDTGKLELTYTTPLEERDGYVAFMQSSRTANFFTIKNEKEPEQTEIEVQKKWVDLEGNDITETLEDETLSVSLMRKAYIDPVNVKVNVTGNDGNEVMNAVVPMDTAVKIELYNKYGADEQGQVKGSDNQPALTFTNADGDEISVTPKITQDVENDPTGVHFIYDLGEIEEDIIIGGRLNGNKNDFVLSIHHDGQPTGPAEVVPGYGNVTISFSDNTGGTDHWSKKFPNLPLTGSEKGSDGIRHTYGYEYYIVENGGLKPLTEVNNSGTTAGTILLTNQKSKTDLEVEKIWLDENGQTLGTPPTDTVTFDVYRAERTNKDAREEYYNVHVYFGDNGVDGNNRLYDEQGTVKKNGSVVIKWRSTNENDGYAATWPMLSGFNFNSGQTDIKPDVKKEKVSDDTWEFTYTLSRVTSDINLGFTIGSNVPLNRQKYSIDWPQATDTISGTKIGEMQLKADAETWTLVDSEDETLSEVVHSLSGSWKAKLDKLPLYTEENGTITYYSYYVVEHPVEDYDVSFSPATDTTGRSRDVESGKITVKNQKYSKNTNLTLEKKWIDKSGAEVETSKIPNSDVTVELYQVAHEEGDDEEPEYVNVYLWYGTYGYGQNYKKIVGVEKGGTITVSIDVKSDDINHILGRAVEANQGLNSGGLVEDTSQGKEDAKKLTITVLEVNYDLNIGFSIAGSIDDLDEAVTVNYSTSSSNTASDGELYGTYQILSEKDWENTIENLPLQRVINGKKVTYTYYVVEKADAEAGPMLTYYIPATDSTARSAATNGHDLTVVNQIVPAELEVEKIWLDSEGKKYEPAEGQSVTFDVIQYTSLTPDGIDKNQYKSVEIRVGKYGVSDDVLVFNDFENIPTGSRLQIELTTRSSTTINAKAYPVGGVFTHDVEGKARTDLTPTGSTSVDSKNTKFVYEYTINDDSVVGFALSPSYPGAPVDVDVHIIWPKGVRSPYGDPITITAADEWRKSVKGLPTSGEEDVDNDGVKEKVYYTYRVVERDAKGFLTTYENNDGIPYGVITVTNQKKDLTTEITVHKAWKDEKGVAADTAKATADGQITFDLYRVGVVDGASVEDDTTKINSDSQIYINGALDSIKNISGKLGDTIAVTLKYTPSDKTIDYSAPELRLGLPDPASNGYRSYRTPTTVKDGDIYTFTYYIPVQSDMVGTNKFNLYYKSGSYIRDINEFPGTWSGTYRVLSGYMEDSKQNVSGGATSAKEYSVIDGSVRERIGTYTIQASDVVEGDHWTKTIKPLDYNETLPDGTVITYYYYIEETGNTVDGRYLAATYDNNGITDGTITVTNQEEESTKIEVKKKWQDADGDELSTKAGDIQVKIMQRGEPAGDSKSSAANVKVKLGVGGYDYNSSTTNKWDSAEFELPGDAEIKIILVVADEWATISSMKVAGNYNEPSLNTSPKETLNIGDRTTNSDGNYQYQFTYKLNEEDTFFVGCMNDNEVAKKITRIVIEEVGVEGEPISRQVDENGDLSEKTYLLYDANGWSRRFTKLPKTGAIDGKQYTFTYDIEEVVPSGAVQVRKDISEPDSNGVVTYTFTNKVETIDIKVVKAWKNADGSAITYDEDKGKEIDDDGEEYELPDSVTVELKKDGSSFNPKKTLTLTAEDGYTGFFEGLQNGPKYTVIEEGTVTGFALETISPADGLTTSGTITVINKKEPDTGTLKVTKTLVGITAQDGHTFKVQITTTVGGAQKYVNRSGELVDTDPGLTVSKSSELSINNVPLGNTYTVTEVLEPGDRTITNFTLDEMSSTTTGEARISAADKDGTVELRNVYSEKTQVSGVKTWVDNKDTHTDPTLTLNRKISTDDDYTVVEGATPTWSGEGKSRTYTFSNLDKYDDNENPYEYIVVENVPTGYAVTYSDGDHAANNGTITNTKTTSISVEKEWKQGETDVTSQVNASIKVTLKSDDEVVRVDADGTTIANAFVLNGVTEDDVNETEAWKYTWTNLPKYKLDDGNVVEITYTVEESEVKLGDINLDATTATEITGGFKITNNLPTVDVQGTKTWVDNKDTHTDPTLALKRKISTDADDTDVTTTYGQPAWTGKGNTRNYKWENLPKYDLSGNEYTYTVAEITIEGYITTSTANTTNGTDFTNAELTQIQAKKIWNNGEGWKTGMSVELTIEQYKGDTKQAGFSTTEADNTNLTNVLISSQQTVTWNNLPKYYLDDNNVVQEYTYQVKETGVSYLAAGAEEATAVQNYRTVFTVTGEGPGTEGLVTINNTETLTITGIKAWKITGTVPDTNPTLTLTRTVTKVVDEEEVTSDPQIVRNADNTDNLQPKWEPGVDLNTKTFIYFDLPKYDNEGYEYTYAVTEASFEVTVNEAKYTYTVEADGTVSGLPEGAPTFTVSQDGNYITNTEKKTFEFSKKWLKSETELEWPDNESITVTVGRTKGTNKENKDNSWTYIYEIKKNDLEIGRVIKPEGFDDPKLKVTIASATDKTYTFKLSDLDAFGKLNPENPDETEGEFVYYVTETKVAGYNEPTYKKNNVVTDGKAVNGGTIINTEESSYALPSTGGIGDIRIIGLVLSLMSLCGFALDEWKRRGRVISNLS